MNSGFLVSDRLGTMVMVVVAVVVFGTSFTTAVVVGETTVAVVVVGLGDSSGLNLLKGSER